MTAKDSETIFRELTSFISQKTYPCVAAKAVVQRDQMSCLLASHMACPADDQHILDFLYRFIGHFRNTTTAFHSAAIIFKEPEIKSEEIFDGLLWQRLQSLARLDAQNFAYDKRVSADPSSPDFSFSVGEEAFFIIGLHPASSRRSRQFKYPTLIFNPHVQFAELRRLNRYNNMKKVVRKRDIQYSGSINPMLADFGESPEVYQYSGLQYDEQWKCPLQISHGEIKDHSTAK